MEDETKEAQPIPDYSTFTSTLTPAAENLDQNNVKPKTVLSETSDILKYNFAEHLPFGIRHLYYLIEGIIGLAFLFAIVLPSLLIITLFGILFRLICCNNNKDQNNSIEYMYYDMHLWLLSHKYIYGFNIFYVFLWQWLNYHVTLYLYIRFTIGSTSKDAVDFINNKSKEKALYYGDYQPFVGGLACSNYNIIKNMMHDVNGIKTKGSFLTLDTILMGKYLDISPVMCSTNSKEHKLSRGYFYALLKPVFGIISKNENENENDTRFNVIFGEIYEPQVTNLMKRIETELIARSIVNGNNTEDVSSSLNGKYNENDVNEVLNSKVKEIRIIAASMLLFTLFWDESGNDTTFVNSMKTDKLKDDIDRCVNNVISNSSALLLPKLIHLPFSFFVNYLNKQYGESMRDFRNLFVRHQNTPSMQNFLNYCESNNMEIENTLYSLLSTLVIAGLLGLDKPIIFGLKLFYKNYEKYKSDMFLKNKKLFIKETVRYLGAFPGTNTMALPRDTEITIRNKKYNIPANTPITLSIGRGNRDERIFGNDSSEFNPFREGLNENILSWNGKECDVMNDRAPRGCPGHDISIFLISKFIDLTLVNELYFNKTEIDITQDKINAIKYEDTMNETNVKKIHSSLSLYNRKMVKVMVESVKKRATQASLDKLPEIISDEKEIAHKLDKNGNFGKNELFGIKLIENDLYKNQYGVFAQMFLESTKSFDKRLYPLTDDNTFFNNDSLMKSRIEMEKYCEKYLYFPTKNVEWLEMKSNKSMSLFAFGGIICHHTTPITSNNNNKIVSLAPKGSKYINDCTWIHDYEVRNGLYRYGAAAYFDENYQLTGIYVSHLDKVYEATLEDDERKEISNGNDLKYAKYVWLTTTLAAITFVDHATVTHLIEANAFVTNMVEKLPLNHWLRRLLTIFTYGTVFINNMAHQILLAENGMAHRIWGFTIESLTKLATDTVKNYQFKEYVNRFDCEMSQLDDKIFPLARDSNEFYQIIHKFVSTMVENYSTISSITDDKDINQFYGGLCNDLKIKDETNNMAFSKENLIKLVANLICSVTVYHEQVGSVVDNLCNALDWNDVKLYKNKKDFTQMSKNDFVMMAILIASTGVRNPYIINDFTHVLLNDEQKEENLKTFAIWQNDLKYLSDCIEKRNKNRRIPFNAVNPRNLECSLSI